MLHQICRTINLINPSTHGRSLMTYIAQRFGAPPASGVYEVGSGIVMDLDTSEHVESAIYFRAFETLCVSVVLDYLKPGGVFVDVGANVGYYSLLAKKRAGPSGRVLAFEANPKTLIKLKRNIEMNELDGIEVFEGALSDKAGTLQLFAPTSTFHHGIKNHGESSLRNQGWAEHVEFTVQADTLDARLPGDVKQIDVLKIDVEGSEPMVFRGAEQTIRKHKPVILMEINKRASQCFDFGPFDAARQLLDYNPGYKLKEIGSHSVRDITFAELTAKDIDYCNLLLVPNK